MVTLFASMDWAAHFSWLESHTRIHLQSKASTAGAEVREPLQGWVLLPKCRHLLGSGVGGVCLSGNDRDREKGLSRGDDGGRDKPDV